jgi:hypothetical protein
LQASLVFSGICFAFLPLNKALLDLETRQKRKFGQQKLNTKFTQKNHFFHYAKKQQLFKFILF